MTKSLLLMTLGRYNVLISNHNRFTKVNSFVTEEFVQFRQVFGLHRFKLHSYLVYRTVKSVWFRQVFGLDRFHCNTILTFMRYSFSSPC